MKNICLISDTHGKIESWVFKHFEDSDEIWHCGDLGTISIIDSINKNFKFRAVYGNIDNAQIRRSFKKDLVFKVEDIKVLMLIDSLFSRTTLAFNSLASSISSGPGANKTGYLFL